MLNTWVAGSVVAVVAGAIGFFVVLRSSAFVAHAVPHGAFGGGAAAVLLGTSTMAGLGVFAVAGALGIGWLGRRGRHDVVTALSLVTMLGLGALFLNMGTEYAPEVYSLLFGEVLGVARNELLPIAAIGAVCLAAVALLYRPLLLSSVLPEAGEARGLRAARMEIAFLLTVALLTTIAVPVVGAFLMFSLTIAPAGTARSLTDRPGRALVLSSGVALVTMWVATAASYESNWPIGFFVGVLGVLSYGLGRAWARRRLRGLRRLRGPSGQLAVVPAHDPVDV